MPTNKKKATQAAAQTGQFRDIAKTIGKKFGPDPNLDALFGKEEMAEFRGKVKEKNATKAAFEGLSDYLKGTKAENKAFLAGKVEPQIKALAAAGKTATDADKVTGAARLQGTQDTTAEMERAYQQLAGGFGKYKGEQDALNESDLAELARYKGQIPGLRDQIAGLEWKDVKSGGPGYEAQLDALQKYKGLTDPTMTAQERFIMEKGRREQEQQERSSRDAVMRDLGARGLRSAGAELTNMLGAQQLTGQNRVMSNLGAQANAVERSMQALQGYGNTAGQMRSADDVIATFNGQQGQLAREEMQKRYQALNKEESDMTTGVNKGVGDRRHQTWGEEKAVANARNMNALGKDQLWDRYYGNRDAYADRSYGRTKDTTGAWMDYGQMYTAGNRADTAPIAGAITAKYGSDVAEAEAKELRKPQGLEKALPWNWFK